MHQGDAAVIWWSVEDVAAVEACLGLDASPFGHVFAVRLERTRRAEDRAEMIAARRLARWALARSVGEPDGSHAEGGAAEDWEIGQRCDRPRCLREAAHGAPFARLASGSRDLPRAVSWSHHRGRIAVAIGTGAADVGVDVVLPDHQPAPIAGSWPAWARAEALVKAGAGELEEMLGAAAARGFSVTDWTVDDAVVAAAWPDVGQRPGFARLRLG